MTLAERIAAEVRASGPVSFARFMERALYEPRLGYYAREGARVGRAGDFVTSPSAAPAFGRTLARLVALAAGAAGLPPRFRVADAGAGEGLLLAALLPAARAALPGCVLEPVVVERGAALRARAVERAAGAAGGGDGVRGLADVGDLASLVPMAGVVFANELFDALPARRLRRGRGGVEEAFVVLEEGCFVERWLPLAPGLAPIADPPADRECAFAAGVEETLAALASGIDRGLLVVIDYGYPSSVLHAPQGLGNPVRGFRAGRLVDDLVSDPGLVDLTAHVDFTRLARAGTSLGLETLFFTDQSHLLLALGFLEDEDAARAKRLIHPEDMGGAFKCLALAKGIAAGDFERLDVRDRRRLLEG